MYSKMVSAIVFLIGLWSFSVLAIDVQITQTQTDETFNYTNEQIITREGDLGLVFGDFNFATLDLSNNKLKVLQEYTLSEYLQSDNKVLSAIMNPDESQFYVIIENHPSLVFAFDKQSGEVTYLRQGPELNPHALFSHKQALIYDPYIFIDDLSIDIRASGPAINIYSYSLEDDTLLETVKYDIGFRYSEETPITDVRFLGDEEFLTTYIVNETNEHYYRQLFRVSGETLQTIGNFHSSEFVENSPYFNVTSFNPNVFQENTLVLSAYSENFDFKSYHNTVFLDVTNNTPKTLYETNSECIFLNNSLNPQQLFLCSDPVNNEEYLLQMESNDEFRIITDIQTINEYKNDFEALPGFEGLIFGETRKFLTFTNEGNTLSYYDGEFGLTILDQGLTERSSNMAVRALKDIGNARKVIRSHDNTYLTYFTSHFRHLGWILALEAQSGTLTFVDTGEELEYAEVNSTNFIANNVMYTLDHVLNFYKLTQGSLAKLSDFYLEGLLPEEYHTYNGTVSATVNGNTILFTARNQTIDNEYAVFSIDVTIDNGTVILSPPTLIAKYNYHWASIFTSKNSEQFSLELRDETLLFTRDISTGNWSERTVTVSGSPTKNSSRWWVNTFSNTSTVYDSENDFASQSIIGNDLYVLDEKWLISYSEEDNLHYYQLIDNDWTLYDSVPISSFSDIGGYDNYTVVFAADNYFYLVGEKAHKTTVEVIRWNFTPPTIRQDQVSITVGESSAVDLLANDTFTDNPMDPDSIEILSVPENINVTRVGATITLTSLDNQLGNFELQYRVADTYGNYAEPVAIKVEVKEPVATPSPPASSSSGSGGAIQYGQILLLLLILCLRQGLMQLK